MNEKERQLQKQDCAPNRLLKASEKHSGEAKYSCGLKSISVLPVGLLEIKNNTEDGGS